jgi:hypothetical protein
VISDYKKITQSVRQWEERQEMVKEKVKWLENGHRKNNILIFGLEERRGESYFDTLEVAKKFLRETMKLEILNGSIDYVARVGKRSGERPILMKLTSFSLKLEVLRKTKNLAGSKFRVDEDFAWETRKTLKDATRRGHRAFLKKDKLIVNGRAYELEYLLGNNQLETGTGGLDTPADNRLEGLEEISQQNKGHAVTRDTTLSTWQSDETLWIRGSLEVVEGEGQNNMSHSTSRNMPENKSKTTACGETTRVRRQAEETEKRIVSSPVGSLVEVHA